jgi:transcription antitermination factor NusG
MDKAWYVVWVSTGQEKEIYLAMQKLPSIERTLFPVEPIWERKDGEWRQRETVMLPGYLFIQCKMDAAIYYKIKDMPHVLGWVGKDTLWPTSVRQEEMDALLMIMACVEAGTDPREWLKDVEVASRQRRGYGTLSLHGKAYKVPFNVYNEKAKGEKQDPVVAEDTDKQPDEPQG